jgi:hypothetical protein
MKDCYHVKTKEEYKQLMKKLEDDGYIWACGDAPTEREDLFDTEGKNLVIVLSTEFNEKILRYTNITWIYENQEKYKILDVITKGTNMNIY